MKLLITEKQVIINLAQTKKIEILYNEGKEGRNTDLVATMADGEQIGVSQDLYLEEAYKMISRLALATAEGEVTHARIVREGL